MFYHFTKYFLNENMNKYKIDSIPSSAPHCSQTEAVLKQSYLSLQSCAGE